MLEEVLFTLLGLLFAFQVGMMWSLKRCENLLLSFDVTLKNAEPGNAIEEMKNEVAELVADVLEGMRPPTIADHLGGVLAQWAQIKMMREVQANGVLPTAMEDSIEAQGEVH